MSKVFFKNLVIAGILAIVIIGGLWIWLGMMTGHGETVTVPPLSGMSVEEAAETLDNRGLEYAVIDSIWSEDAVGGTIIEQIPEGGKEVKENRKILLTIYRYSAVAERLGISEGEVAEVAMIKLRNKGVHFSTKYESNVLLDGMIV
ncbi:MAG: PASTA domain-containing protein, partial [Flavobacteriales bacterium]|nr:PASTA domain-containing protein [Flavobacteriales bacterium]